MSTVRPWRHHPRRTAAPDWHDLVTPASLVGTRPQRSSLHTVHKSQNVWALACHATIVETETDDIEISPEATENPAATPEATSLETAPTITPAQEPAETVAPL